MASNSAEYKRKGAGKGQFQKPPWTAFCFLILSFLTYSSAPGTIPNSLVSLHGHLRAWCFSLFSMDLCFNIDGYLSAFLVLLRLHRVLGLDFRGRGGVPLAGLAGSLELKQETSLITVL